MKQPPKEVREQLKKLGLVPFNEKWNRRKLDFDDYQWMRIHQWKKKNIYVLVLVISTTATFHIEILKCIKQFQVGRGKTYVSPIIS